MNKKVLTLITALTILLCAIFSACTQEDQSNPNTPSVTSSSYDVIIKELEEKILELQQNHYMSEAESQKQIEELQNKLDKLREEANAATNATTTAETTLPKAIFIYSLKDGKAIISGFTGDTEHIVIPSRIDGFEVYGISSNAFEGYSFKSVIISEGVEHIDWFAFYNCKNLSSITIPSSVRKIGYSAFDGCAKGFTVYCHSGSFAQSYAQSYGITYALI